MKGKTSTEKRRENMEIYVNERRKRRLRDG